MGVTFNASTFYFSIFGNLRIGANVLFLTLKSDSKEYLLL